MIDDTHTTDTHLPGVPVLSAIREEFAKAIHNIEHGSDHEGDPTCWAAWLPEADALMPIARTYLAAAWEEGARHGARGLLPTDERVKRNPYRRGA